MKLKFIGTEDTLFNDETVSGLPETASVNAVFCFSLTVPFHHARPAFSPRPLEIT
jgi:hypothetical protein